METKHTIEQREALKKQLTQMVESTDSIIEIMEKAPTPKIKAIHYRALDHKGNSNVELINDAIIKIRYQVNGKHYYMEIIKDDIK